MLTSASAPRTVRDDRPGYRPYRVRVVRIEAIGPSFRRVTFTGPDLDGFGRDGRDQRVKLLLPIGPDQPVPDLGPEWYPAWQALPDADRAPIRTYTVRALRPGVRELDVDFVLHPDHGPTGHVDGPAARWLAGAGPGSELVIVGPDARSRHSGIGIDWHPGPARELLLAGDETALPAIAGIVASLDERQHASVFVELASSADAQPLDSSARLDVRWLERLPDARGSRLHDALTGWLAANPGIVREAGAHAVQPLDDVDVDAELLWDSPDEGTGEFYAWLAGEAAMIKSLRRLLVTDAGIDRTRVAFMGYWRHGRSERN